jgi:hypothetical protein
MSRNNQLDTVINSFISILVTYTVKLQPLIGFTNVKIRLTNYTLTKQKVNVV